MSKGRSGQTVSVKHNSELIVEAPTSKVVAVLADLTTYPSWNDLVSAATPTEPVDGDAGPAWKTTLTAKVGPFARSKQLRFVREALDQSSDSATIAFVRKEDDGRSHATWLMECDVREKGDHAVVSLSLAYDGGLWVPSLGSVLDSAIERATRRLPEYMDQQR